MNAKPALSDENRRLLVSGAHLLGVSLDKRAVEAFDRIFAELTKWNRKMNLTALCDERSVVVRHFLDSLAPARYLPPGASVLDIGPGAGFPGIPLKIARPDLGIVLLEATRKKTYFHKHLIRTLDLAGIRSVWGRSDAEQVRTDLRGDFDAVISRAALPLGLFLQEAVYFLRAEGMIVAMRGREPGIPIRPESLGLTLCRTVLLNPPFDLMSRKLLFFRKTGTSKSHIQGRVLKDRPDGCPP
ncbi:MAG: 16S rRNA (guanine(527)-N(7))-methyltransferase RsmG [Deltaproteobacteria bacterium]|nr:16S rRNA (guanine(527)-N(7))-methyltransferase RsmG [Deltaproteobacteria bacterium]